MSKRRVLFLCNANSARSLMGEVLLRHMAGDRFESFSAGSEPDEPHALTLEALNWQVKLRTSLALSRVEQDDDLRFPIGGAASSEDNNKTLGESSDTGLSGNLMAEGQYRFSNNWIVAGYIGKAFAVEYQAFEAGIQIRWREGQGTGVTSDELLLSSPRLSGFAL